MSLTCVTGYWNIKNKHGNKFEDWFENTLAVNNPYIIFSDKEGIESMKKNRDDLPTHYIEMDIDEFGGVRWRRIIDWRLSQNPHQQSESSKT